MPALLAMLGPDGMDLLLGSLAVLLAVLAPVGMDLVVTLLLTVVPTHLFPLVLVAGVSTGLLIGVRVRCELGLTSWHSRAVTQTARTLQLLTAATLSTYSSWYTTTEYR